MKKEKLLHLRQKAANRNPDEFHFAMMSTQTSRGIKVGDRGNSSLSPDVVKLLKTQDAGYLRVVAQKTLRDREQLEEHMQQLYRDAPDNVEKAKGHVFFVESTEDQNGKVSHRSSSYDSQSSQTVQPTDISVGENDSEYVAASGEVVSQTITDVGEAGQALSKEEKTSLQRKRQKWHKSQVTRLNALRLRERELASAQNQLAMQRAKMSHTVGGVNRDGLKFKVRERKK